MKVMRNWADLEQFGIVCLTGEACGLSMRALCDVTDKGRDIVREFLGLPYNAEFQQPWNSKGVGSCFLPWSSFPDLAAFCLLRAGGCLEAVHVPGEVAGVEPADSPDDWAKWCEFHASNVIRRYRPLHARTLSNEHAMSGRTQ